VVKKWGMAVLSNFGKMFGLKVLVSKRESVFFLGFPFNKTRWLVNSVGGIMVFGDGG
jgi:hypothetical protein